MSENGNTSERLFANAQGNLFEKADEERLKEERNKPVECLGMTFPNDEARRTYFLDKLREKLKDPEFRKIEGFPIGEDEDILALSDPPYYTACPNPWIGDFIAAWEAAKPEKLVDYEYHREPFAADVSEGKNDPIYNAHSYHTKVPHKAIMRYILHYTEPGDIVFDGFCGTGMTGVAAQMCGDRATVESLGYDVDKNGVVYNEEYTEEGKKVKIPFSKLGARQALLNDLSPAATFIAYNYNTPVDVHAFEHEAKQILTEVESECGWMYETWHDEAKGIKGKINYMIWSDVFVCPDCSSDVVFWEAAVDKEAGKVLDTFPCPHCHAELAKRKMGRSWATKFDSALNNSIKQAKQVPVLISYTVRGSKGRYDKKPDTFDLALIEKIEDCEFFHWFPTERLMEGKETRRNDPIGITHVHHFYSKRNLYVFALFLEKTKNNIFQNHFWGAAKDCQSYATKMVKINIKRLLYGGGQFMGFVGGTLYIPSLNAEQSVLSSIVNKVKKVAKNYKSGYQIAKGYLISTGSLTSCTASEGSLDYIFLDPPFGANIQYSELNVLWESWLGTLTNNKTEAVENSSHGKSLDDYRKMMTDCFEEAYRLLKPGRWMTVEFSNTKASVWNNIQTALTEAGFIVANVSALDKKQGSFKAVTTPTAVKQDLIISAYKPNGGFEARFIKEAQSEEGIWDFVRTHLGYLPVVKKHGSEVVLVPERDPRILFDQMVAYYVRKGYDVPLSSLEFQQGLMTRFAERDGMYFLPHQVIEYDRKRMLAGGIDKQTEMFVKDEATAIDWLRNLLHNKPQSFQDINPQFMQEISGWDKHETPLELSILLEQNFLCYDGKSKVPEQIHRYLSSNWKDMRNLQKDDPVLVNKARDRWYVIDPSKAGDLEKYRERLLLREFWDYLPEGYKPSAPESTESFLPGLKPKAGPVPKGKRLKIIRLEAVRTGFKHCWQNRDYPTIIAVAQRIPQLVLEEDPKLLMWYDQAVTRMGEGL